jgi:hypothetical protein
MTGSGKRLQGLSAGSIKKDALESSGCSRGCGDETQERQRFDGCGPVEAITLSRKKSEGVKTIMSCQPIDKVFIRVFMTWYRFAFRIPPDKRPGRNA